MPCVIWGMPSSTRSLHAQDPALQDRIPRYPLCKTLSLGNSTCGCSVCVGGGRFPPQLVDASDVAAGNLQTLRMRQLLGQD